MRLEHIVGGVAGHLAGRLLRRVLLALATVVLAIVAVYYFTAAGLLALAAQYGDIYAYLIVGAIYAAVAAIGAIIWLVQGRPVGRNEPALGHGRETQLIMLVEAVMLGYALARRGERAS